MAIVGYLKKFEATVLNENFQSGGACIDGVFDELFQGMNGRNNNLSGCDLVDNILRQGLYTAKRYRCVTGSAFGAGRRRGVYLHFIPHDGVGPLVPNKRSLDCSVR